MALGMGDVWPSPGRIGDDPAVPSRPRDVRTSPKARAGVPPFWGRPLKMQDNLGTGGNVPWPSPSPRNVPWTGTGVFRSGTCPRVTLGYSLREEELWCIIRERMADSSQGRSQLKEKHLLDRKQGKEVHNWFAKLGSKWRGHFFQLRVQGWIDMGRRGYRFHKIEWRRGVV